MLKVIAAVVVLVLLNMRELLKSKQRGKVMVIYFTIIGISLLLGILISIDRQPTSPAIVLMNIIKVLGLGDQ